MTAPLWSVTPARDAVFAAILLRAAFLEAVLH
jgi:hypothetical protein